MGILSSLFGKKSTPTIKTPDEFWAWFSKNEASFFKIIQSGNNIDKDLFPKLSPMLDQLHEGILFLVGMHDTKTAELVLSADGVVKNIPFIEELTSLAPSLTGWKFTALKPAMDIAGFGLNMAGNTFNEKKLFFHANEDLNTPDKINLVIVHTDFQESDRSNFTTGIFIFLDNYLGELKMVTMIDDLSIVGKEEVTAELIPISRLKDYLIWRETEFIEKYGELRYLEEKGNFNSLEAELENGKRLIAIINSSLLDWDGKASHPWVMAIEIKYNGAGRNGMPDERTYELMGQFEDQLLENLVQKDGHLNIGRQTADGLRVIYFACADFRSPVRVTDQAISEFAGKLNISYSIYKDKYWETFDRFIPKVS